MALARILHQQPQLAIMDEPFSAMDTALGKDLLDKVLGAGISVLMTGQPDCPMAMHADRTYALCNIGDGSWVSNS